MQLLAGFVWLIIKGYNCVPPGSAEVIRRGRNSVRSRQIIRLESISPNFDPPDCQR